jgi:hypothetical protein
MGRANNPNDLPLYSVENLEVDNLPDPSYFESLLGAPILALNPSHANFENEKFNPPPPNTSIELQNQLNKPRTSQSIIVSCSQALPKNHLNQKNKHNLINRINRKPIVSDHNVVKKGFNDQNDGFFNYDDITTNRPPKITTESTNQRSTTLLVYSKSPKV